MVDTLSFDSEEDELLTSVLSDYTICMRRKPLLDPLDWFNRIRDGEILRVHLERLRELDDENPLNGVFGVNAKCLGEVMRPVLLLHESGRNLSAMEDKEGIVCEFLLRIHEHGTMANRKRKEEGVGA